MNEKDLRKNLYFFKVPQSSIESIRSNWPLRNCNTFREPCDTCQTAPMSADPEPHAVGMHFVGSITGIEEIPVVNPTPPEREEQPLTDTRFRASVRGWINHAHQHRAQTLIDMRDERMTATLQRDKDIILIPRDWWKDEAKSLGPGDLGWWYTVNKATEGGGP